MHDIQNFIRDGVYKGKFYSIFQRNAMVGEFWELNKVDIANKDIFELERLCVSNIERGNVGASFNNHMRACVESIIYTNLNAWKEPRIIQSRVKVFEEVGINIVYDSDYGIVNLGPNIELQQLLSDGYPISMMTAPVIKRIVEPAFETYMESFDSKEMK